MIMFNGIYLLCSGVGLTFFFLYRLAQLIIAIGCVEIKLLLSSQIWSSRTRHPLVIFGTKYRPESYVIPIFTNHC